MAVHVRFKTDLNPFNDFMILALMKHGSAKITYATDRLWKDDAVELNVISSRNIAFPFLSLSIVRVCLYDPLVSHIALFHQAISKWFRGNYLSLWSLFRTLTLFIHEADVIEQFHVQCMTTLSTGKFVYGNDISRLQIKVMH